MYLGVFIWKFGFVIILKKQAAEKCASCNQMFILNAYIYMTLFNSTKSA